MINRKIDKFLEDFFSKSDKKALLVTGARQIGKTFSIRQFGKKRYKSFVEINFIQQPDLVPLFSNVSNSADLLLRISSVVKGKLINRNTLIFLDEVQCCPEIVTAIKFLVDEGSYDYVLSGSLLGVELNDLRSVPVGYLAVKNMYPLDFEEFLLAYGVKENVIDKLRECFSNLVPVDDFVHGKILELFRLYLIVGGMPEAVKSYLDTNNLQNVSEIQRQIINMYKKDISKYDKDNKLYIQEIFDLIPPELNAKNKRFILKKLNENFKFSRYENSFLWLKDAGVAIPVYNVDEPRLPLLLSRERNLFKLFLSDIGLLSCMYANGIQMEILSNNKSINFGSVYENAIAQELLAHGFASYFFNNKKLGELDFVIEYQGKPVPLEIKSGKDYNRHNALSNVLKVANYDIRKAYVLSNENLKLSGQITYLPIYMIMFFSNETRLPVSYRVDISGL